MPKASSRAEPAVVPEAPSLPEPPLPASYEAALEELERLLQRLEAGNTPLDELLGSYQRGAQLLQYCRSRLDVLEQQIKVLDDGVLKPWSDA